MSVMMWHANVVATSWSDMLFASTPPLLNHEMHAWCQISLLFFSSSFFLHVTWNFKRIRSCNFNLSLSKLLKTWSGLW